MFSKVVYCRRKKDLDFFNPRHLSTKYVNACTVTGHQETFLKYEGRKKSLKKNIFTRRHYLLERNILVVLNLVFY